MDIGSNLCSIDDWIFFYKDVVTNMEREKRDTETHG